MILSDLAIYLAYSLVLLLISFWVFRIIVRKDYLNKGRLSPLSYILETGVFALHANLPYVFARERWMSYQFLPQDPLFRQISLFVILIGLAILLAAWFGLGTGTSFGQDKNRLKTTGLYRYSRNPQLLGYGIILLVFAFSFRSWYSLGWFVQYVIISGFMISSEEEFLRKQYSEEYEEYCRRSSRIIGLPR